MSNREVLSSPKPFKKRAHRPWHADLLEDDAHAPVPTQKTIPIISNPPKKTAPVQEHGPDKGRMLIGGFFKPEGLMPDFLSTLEEHKVPSQDTSPVDLQPTVAPKVSIDKTPLKEQIQAFSEKWEATEINESAITAETSKQQQTMVDLNNTEALLETILKAKQQ